MGDVISIVGSALGIPGSDASDAPSVKNITTVINDAVINTITTSLQSASASATARQILNIDCQDISQIDNRIENCFIAMKQVGTTDALLEVCGPQSLVICGANGVTISGSINVHLDTTESNQAVQQVSNTLTSNLSSLMSQQANSLIFSSAEENSIKDISNIVQNLTAQFIQQDLIGIQQSQIINLKNVQVRVASLETVTNLIKKNIIQNNAYQGVVNNIATTILAKSTQDNKLQGPLTTLMYVFAIIVGLLIFFGVALWIIKKNRK